jgi:hypothetical protein
MRILFGHEITLDCLQPTPLLCLTTVHPDHARPRAEPVLAAPERITTVPPVPMPAGRDLYGNACLRMVARPGRCTLRAEGDAGRASHLELSS